MKKLFKNNLDEMQEQKLKTVESKNFWILYTLLTISIFVQIILGSDFKVVLGELTVLGISAVSVSIGSMKNHVWGRSIKPSFKSNVILSLLGGFIAATVSSLAIYMQYNTFEIKLFEITFLSTFSLIFVILLIMLILYNKKEKEINNTIE